MDYEAAYKNLYNDVQKANTDKKDRLASLNNDIEALLGNICDPDPPGCSGSLGTGTYDDLAKKVQDANADKRRRLMVISKEAKTLFDKICDPDPPGCSS